MLYCIVVCRGAGYMEQLQDRSTFLNDRGIGVLNKWSFEMGFTVILSYIVLLFAGALDT